MTTNQQTGASHASDEQIVEITRDVWTTFTGKAIEPAGAEAEPAGDDVTVGCVAVTGGWQGCVLLAAPTPLARTVASAMFDLPADRLTDDEVADALGELTNMVAGNLKSLLPGPSGLSMPAVTAGTSYTVRIPRGLLVNRVAMTSEGQRLTVSVWQT
jgi:chemotaxis protein CheX